MLLALTVCATAIGCGKTEVKVVEEEKTESAFEEEEPVAEEPEVVEEEPVVDEPEEEAGEVAPEGMGRSYLTGKWVTEAYANQRPVGVMIENTEVCQPSYGSSQAEVIYEFQAEGGITRLLALFEDISGLDRLGNIRSCRPYFAYTAIAHDAIYIHCGGSIEAYQEILNIGKIDNIDEIYRGKYFFRASDRNAPHNLYTSTNQIVQAVQELGYRDSHTEDFDGYFQFNKDDNNDIQLDGQDAMVVRPIQRNPNPWFEYSEADGVYYRYEFGKAQTDTYTGKQLSAKNVIIQYAPVDAYYDEQDHDRVDIDILCGGKGWYCTNGKAIPITWTCAGNGQVTHYYDASGNEITLNQGKTWIDVVDTDDQEKQAIFASKDEYNANK